MLDKSKDFWPLFCQILSLFPYTSLCVLFLLCKNYPLCNFWVAVSFGDVCLCSTSHKEFFPLNFFINSTGKNPPGGTWTSGTADSSLYFCSNHTHHSTKQHEICQSVSLGFCSPLFTTKSVHLLHTANSPWRDTLYGVSETRSTVTVLKRDLNISFYCVRNSFDGCCRSCTHILRHPFFSFH